MPLSANRTVSWLRPLATFVKGEKVVGLRAGRVAADQRGPVAEEVLEVEVHLDLDVAAVRHAGARGDLADLHQVEGRAGAGGRAPSPTRAESEGQQANFCRPLTVSGASSCTSSSPSRGSAASSCASCTSSSWPLPVPQALSVGAIELLRGLGAVSVKSVLDGPTSSAGLSSRVGQPRSIRRVSAIAPLIGPGEVVGPAGRGRIRESALRGEARPRRRSPAAALSG